MDLFKDHLSDIKDHLNQKQSNFNLKQQLYQVKKPGKSLYYYSSNDKFTSWKGFTVSNSKSHISMVNLTYENRSVFESAMNHYKISKKTH